jgi:hypothetical protein
VLLTQIYKHQENIYNYNLFYRTLNTFQRLQKKIKKKFQKPRKTPKIFPYRSKKKIKHQKIKGDIIMKKFLLSLCIGSFLFVNVISFGKTAIINIENDNVSNATYTALNNTIYDFMGTLRGEDVDIMSTIFSGTGDIISSIFKKASYQKSYLHSTTITTYKFQKNHTVEGFK